MPARNCIKPYFQGAHYHVYNRGVEGRPIFLDPVDYNVFLKIFKRYLSAEEIKDSCDRIYPKLLGEVELLAYCLMPNHFHLLIKQSVDDGLIRLMRRVMTAYSMYFNKKYQREGTLFQSRYKARLISDGPDLLHVSRYIHLNPLALGSTPQQYPYSSFALYSGRRSADWLNPDTVLDLLPRGEYPDFVVDYGDVAKTLKEVQPALTL